MREVADLGKDERLALLVGKPRDVREQGAQFCAALDVLHEIVCDDFSRILAGLLATGAEHRQAAVAGDRVEPGLDVQIAAVVALDVLVRGEEGVLYRILGIRDRTEHVTAEAEDAAAVAVVKDFEGRRLAVPDVLDQPLVGQGCEQPARPRDPEGVRAWRGSDFHALSIGQFGPR